LLLLRLALVGAEVKLVVELHLQKVVAEELAAVYQLEPQTALVRLKQ
jgi:hypothetical protein